MPPGPEGRFGPSLFDQIVLPSQVQILMKVVGQIVCVVRHEAAVEGQLIECHTGRVDACDVSACPMPIAASGSKEAASSPAAIHPGPAAGCNICE